LYKKYFISISDASLKKCFSPTCFYQLTCIGAEWLRANSGSEIPLQLQTLFINNIEVRARRDLDKNSFESKEQLSPLFELFLF
jgi:hypothetical protein